MKRGGKRTGAGRKPILGSDQRLVIGLECEAQWRRAGQARAQKELADYEARHGLDEMLEAMMAVPANMIRKKDGKPAREIVIELAATDADLPQDLPDLIVSAVLELRNRRAVLERTGCLFAMPTVRPKGKRETVLAFGARLVLEEYGVNVTARFVDRCWREARKLEQAISNRVSD